MKCPLLKIIIKDEKKVTETFRVCYKEDCMAWGIDENLLILKDEHQESSCQYNNKFGGRK